MSLAGYLACMREKREESCEPPLGVRMFFRLSLLVVALVLPFTVDGKAVPPQAKLTRRDVPLVYSDGLAFKDLNRNGKLDPYEDWRLTPEQRARDLMGRMSLEEKAGIMTQDY